MFSSCCFYCDIIDCMKQIISSVGVILIFFFYSSVSLYAFGKAEAPKGKALPSDSVITVKEYKIPSITEQAAAGYWITRSSGNSLVIIGVSSLMVKQEDEIASAREDAARKAAMYHSVKGKVESIQNSGANYFDYIADSKIELDYDTDSSKYVEKLAFDPQKDVVKVNNTVFVRFTYPAESTPVNFTATLNEKGRPNWTYSRDLPQVDGYKTTVGFARNQVKLKDAIKKSSEAAAARMIEDMSMQVISSDKSATGQGSSSLIQTKSEGSINNFQIIEFWIDSETGNVYTLAIAKQGN